MRFCGKVIASQKELIKIVMEKTEKARTPAKIVYLDQKCWIDIAKLYYGQPSEEEKELVEKIFQSSEKGQLIFPLSISHFEETMKIGNSRRKSARQPVAKSISLC